MINGIFLDKHDKESIGFSKLTNTKRISCIEDTKDFIKDVTYNLNNYSSKKDILKKLLYYTGMYDIDGNLKDEFKN